MRSSRGLRHVDPVRSADIFICIYSNMYIFIYNIFIYIHLYYIHMYIYIYTMCFLFFFSNYDTFVLVWHFQMAPRRHITLRNESVRGQGIFKCASAK